MHLDLPATLTGPFCADHRGFSESFRAGCVSVSYPVIDGKLICRVDVKRSRKPVYLKIADGAGTPTDRLIVRAGASSPEIPLSQIATYVREHFET